VYHNRFFLALTVDKNTTKFKEWLDIASLVELKPNTDVIEVLGYFAYESVREVGHSLYSGPSSERVVAIYLILGVR